jgi:addiction module HigA family antidote
MSEQPIMPPVHPGEILREAFLEPLGVSDYALAKAIHVPQTRISAIVSGRRRITADTGLRLARFFGMSEGFFTGLQEDYDLAITKDGLADLLDRIQPLAS